MTDYKQPLSIILVLVGTGAGFAWVLLGVAALKHLEGADEGDRVYGWTLWWFVDSDRYTPHGKRLCLRGWLACGVGVAAWLGWAALR